MRAWFATLAIVAAGCGGETPCPPMQGWDYRLEIRGEFEPGRYELAMRDDRWELVCSFELPMRNDATCTDGLASVDSSDGGLLLRWAPDWMPELATVQLDREGAARGSSEAQISYRYDEEACLTRGRGAVVLDLGSSP